MVICLYITELEAVALIFLTFFQDILGNDSIKLDWTFRYSLINDIIKVCLQFTGTFIIHMKLIIHKTMQFMPL